MNRLLKPGAILFSATLPVLGVSWVVCNIATSEALTWFATPAPTVLLGAVIIALWLLAIVLPLRWWIRARRRTAAA